MNKGHTIARRTSSRSSRLRGALDRRGTRGAVLVEYSFLLVAVVIPTVAGIIAGGVLMMQTYQAGRSAMMSSKP